MSMFKKSLCLCFLLCGAVSAKAESPLSPVKTENPRATMETFLKAMNEHRKVVDKDAQAAAIALNRAVRTLDGDQFPVVTRADQSQEAAILLKEVIDRVIVIDLKKIPGEEEDLPVRWRLKDTEITIAKMTEGPRAGEFLFSSDTVFRAREFYQLVETLPYLPGSGQGAGYRVPLFQRVFGGSQDQLNFGLYGWQWLGLLLILIASFVFRVTTVRIIEIFKRYARRTSSSLDNNFINVIEQPVGLIVATGVWFVGIRFLRLEGELLAYVSVLIQILFSFAIVWLAYRISGLAGAVLEVWAQRAQFPLDQQLLPMLNRAFGLLTLIVGTLIAIQNLGVNVMSLLAGLGLGGLAFALAFRDTAANLFGSIMILWDQPFRVGDWIKAGSAEGTVEEIGFRSTRVRTFYNSLVSIPNSILAAENIDNMGLRQYRRIVTTLGVTYDTPPEKLESFIDGIKKVLELNTYTRKDYYHVVFSGYGASSLDVMLYFFVEVADWAQELKQREAIYFEILRLAKNLDVSFAFPSQSIYVEKSQPLFSRELQSES